MISSDRPLVSFVVLAYNQRSLVSEAFASAVAQNYSPLEIVLSDDCSTDDTFAQMMELAAYYRGPHKIRLNRNAKNLHIGAHIQKAAELSSGELIIVNAGDDVSETNRVERLVNAWTSSNPRPDLLHSDARSLAPDGKLGAILKPHASLRSSPSPMELAKSGEGVIGATQAWSRALFERFPRLDKHIRCEDRILPFRATLGGGVRYVEEPLVRYRTGGISADFTAASPYDVLWGSALKVHRWFADGFAQMRRDVEARSDLEVDPTLVGVLLEQEARHVAPLTLAAAPYVKRWALAAALLRDERLTLRDRLRPAMMYLAPKLWSLQFKAKRRLGLL